MLNRKLKIDLDEVRLTCKTAFELLINIFKGSLLCTRAQQLLKIILQLINCTADEASTLTDLWWQSLG